MYRDHFECQELPFSIAPDPRFLFMSERHREALAHLVYGMNTHGGFVLVTGEVGTGKTTICRCLLEQIPDNVDLAFIFNPRLTTSELLAIICDEFAIPYPAGNKSVKIFVDGINAFLLDAHAKGRRAVLILDEAQNLHPSLLEQIRLLTNLETNERKLLQIIMLGQPELLRVLASPELRQLSQRITARYHLDPLDLNETRAYVNHRLNVAGIREELFSSAVIRRLYRLSGGIPRIINVICDRALLGAYVRGDKVVKKTTLTTAAREVLGGREESERQGGAFWWRMAAIVLVVFGLVFATDFYQKSQVESESTAIPEIFLIPETVPEMAVEVEVEPPATVSLVWPEVISDSMSKILAYQTLFDQWDIEYFVQEDGQACHYAGKQGLSCLFKRGSLGSLRQFNRPAVLRLSDEKGGEFFGTLLCLSDETAVLSLGFEEIEVVLSELQKHWLGEFTLLWRLPPGYKDMVEGRGKNKFSDWLVERLASLQSQSVSFADISTEFVVDSHQLVETFQAAQGLRSDGIAGPQTIIRINTVTDDSLPVLIHAPEEG